MVRRAHWLVFIWLAIIPNTLLAGCFDLSKGEPGRLVGQLSYRIFPGPPNYEDVQTGDTPEPAWILQLSTPICLTGDEFSNADRLFDTVHLVPNNEITSAFSDLTDLIVEVNLFDPYASHTGHHHAPLVATVSAIRAVDDDSTAEYGTAATTVRAFYLALGQGDGVEAVGYVMPEKRGLGAYVAANMTNFYGNLTEPLRLLDIQQTGPDKYNVRYYFRSFAGICDGRAVVATARSDERFYIRSIDAVNGC